MGKSEDNIEDLNLPPGVHALVEGRINDAIDRLRDHNDADLRHLARDHAKKWMILTVLSWALTIATLIIAPTQIPKWIQQYVDDHMTKPEMEKIADNAIQMKMGDYVDTKVAPIESSVDAAKSNVDEVVSDLSNLARHLDATTSEFKGLSQEVTALRAFFNAKLGDAAAFRLLEDLAAKPQGKDEHLATLLQKDLEAQYSDFRSDKLGTDKRRLIHVQTLKPYKAAAEQLHWTILHDKSPYQRRAEINHIADRGMKYFVQDLVGVATNDSNLFVQCRAVSALETLTGKSFSQAPPFDDISNWWQTEGMTNVTFQSPFAQIDAGNRLLAASRLIDAIDVYERCISNHTGLAQTHFNLFKAYWIVGKKEQATNSLNAAITEAEAQTEALITYAAISAQDGQQVDSLTKLKQAKPFVKNFAAAIESDERFTTMKTNLQFQALVKDGK